eukprot:gb/GEZN01005729.1/.p1 GENE.gb/GEZN01005729.1/~~gb/GEZN01005729.1/.p1  ORF type:complete len:539 (-),score=39.11 gb/GEZN01005729.1/:50-1666(-)
MYQLSSYDHASYSACGAATRSERYKERCQKVMWILLGAFVALSVTTLLYSSFLLAHGRDQGHLSIYEDLQDWQSLDNIVQAGVDEGVYPGAVAVVALVDDHNHLRFLYHKAFGALTFHDLPPYLPTPPPDHPPPVTLNTIYDLSSLTQVLVTSTALAQLHQAGLIPSLDEPVCSEHLLGKRFCIGAKAHISITLRQCLLHTAGFPAEPDPPYNAPSFNCPESVKTFPKKEYTCQPLQHASFLAQPLVNAPGTTYLYSDISMFALSWVIGSLARRHSLVQPSELDPECVAAAEENYQSLADFSSATLAVDQCFFLEYVERYIAEAVRTPPVTNHHLADEHSNADSNGWNANHDSDHDEQRGFSFGFNPPQAIWRMVAPTEDDTTYRKTGVIQGQVHDEQAFACGGVQGHAGLFGTASSVTSVLAMWLGASGSLLEGETRKLFTTKAMQGPSRALGWDTKGSMPDHQAPCGSLSSSTFFQTGITGTMACVDPQRKLQLVLLTNSIYPSRNGPPILPFQTAFSSEAQVLFDQYIMSKGSWW